jgi:hypothetical protein
MRVMLDVVCPVPPDRVPASNWSCESSSSFSSSCLGFLQLSWRPSKGHRVQQTSLLGFQTKVCHHRESESEKWKVSVNVAVDLHFPLSISQASNRNPNEIGCATTTLHKDGVPQVEPKSTRPAIWFPLPPQKHISFTRDLQIPFVLAI